MPLQFQLQQMPFRYGLAEGVDPRQAPAGTLMTAENVAWKQSGRIEKRLGTTSLVTTAISGSAIAAASRLFTRGDELCLIDGSSLYAYSPSAVKWNCVAAVPDVALTHKPLIDPTLGVQASDSGIYGNLLVSAYVTGDPTIAPVSGGVTVCISDMETGALVLSPTVVTASAIAKYVRVCIVGSTAVLVASGTDATIRAYTVNLSTYAISAATNLRTDRTNSAAQNWDAATIAGTSNFVLAYKNNAGSLALYSHNASLVVQASGTEATADVPAFLAVSATTSESIYVAYSATAVVKCYVASPSTMTTTVAPFTVEDVIASSGDAVYSVGVCRYSSTSAVIAYARNEVAAGNNVPSLASKVVTSAGAVTANTRRNTYGVWLTSAPFLVNSKCYAFGTLAATISTAAPVAPFTGNASCLFSLYPGPDDGTSAVSLTHPYVASADNLLGATAGFSTGLPRFSARSSTSIVGALPVLGDAPNSGQTWRCGLRVVSLTAGTSAPADLWRSVNVGSEAYVSCGVLTTYDGADVFDYGFPYAPTLSSQTTSGAGGVIAAGSYIYGGHLEYRAGSGMLYRGVTFVGEPLATAGATSSNTLTITNVNVGNKKRSTTERFTTSVPIYRSTVGGTVPQRLTEEPTFNLSPVTFSAVAQTFVDTKADAAIDTTPITLASRPAIYTSGGVLDDYAPPASVSMFRHADRLWCLAGDQKTWWYSKAFQDDLGVAPGFNPAFLVTFAEKQTAGASMDDKAVFFSETGVAYMQGTGPAANGGSSDFSTPTKIQSDVGCTNARSVVSMPDGLMFQSARGIYLLTRGLELVWIGRPVKDTLASYPTVTSAVLVAKHNQVRFTCNATGGATGVVLVYDYVEKQWSVSKYSSTAVSYGCPIADACMWGGEWTFATPTGQVLQENASTSAAAYLDDSTVWIPMKLETAWISAAGPVAFQSVRTFALHGESFTAHDLTVSVGFDSDTSYPQTETWLAGTPVTTVGVEECELIIGTRRKCSTIRFKVQDAEPTTGTIGTGRGPAFDMMGIEVGIKAGFAGQPATKRG